VVYCKTLLNDRSVEQYVVDQKEMDWREYVTTVRQ
jgi:hypothetical protein